MKHRRPTEESYPHAVGRYLLHQPFARGGMASVHAAHLFAAEGVTRLVAVKRLHPQFVDDPEFVAMFHDEARIASRIHHPNVVPVLDVILEGDEAILVQEYVHGVPLSYLLKLAVAASEPIPLSIVLTVVAGVLSGLHAAHEATDDLGEPLGIVHRDVSPQNVLVSIDGMPRLVDFGIAKARTSLHHTREGFLKGKLAYMAPEQLRAEPVTRAADIYAAGVLLWELILNRRFHDGSGDVGFVHAVANGATPTPVEVIEAERSAFALEDLAQVYLLDPIVTRAMSTRPELRYSTAADMAAELAGVAHNASAVEVAAWVRSAAADYLEKRRTLLMTGDESCRAGRPPVTGRRVDEPRGSWTRMRLDAVTMDGHPTVTRERRTSLPPSVMSVTLRPAVDVETHVIPWVMVAALLIVVGTIVGMVTTRDTTTAAEGPAPATAAARPAAAGPALAAGPAVREGAAEGASAGAVVTSVGVVEMGHPPPKEVVPPSRPPAIRYGGPGRAAPVVVRAAPSAAASARECSPLVYFEGSKKVLKPSCL